MWLVYVELSGACFSFEVTSDGWVIQAAPIAAWTISRRGRKVVGYYRRRGGRVRWQQVPHRLCHAGDDAGLLRCLVCRGPRALYLRQGFTYVRTVVLSHNPSGRCSMAGAAHPNATSARGQEPDRLRAGGAPPIDDARLTSSKARR